MIVNSRPVAQNALPPELRRIEDGVFKQLLYNIMNVPVSVVEFCKVVKCFLPERVGEVVQLGAKHPLQTENYPILDTLVSEFVMGVLLHCAGMCWDLLAGRCHCGLHTICT